MNLSPREIVNELDKYIIGQADAKRAVAVALRNRYRRSQLSKEMRDEITPKNIIMKGPTGVGKTEIARRLAKLVKAPFIKVEATKYTEVGYVGRDCESMIRDLVEVSVRLVKDEKMREVGKKAKENVANKIADIMIADLRAENPDKDINREDVLRDLIDGKYDSRTIEITVAETAKAIGVMPGVGAGDLDIGGMLGSIFPPQRKKKKMTVENAFDILMQEESDKLIDNDSVNSEAIRRAEQEGIVFIDEIDKIASKGAGQKGPDVSRGCTVNTKYGPIKTDYILFIAAGAFHISSVEDLIPEFQGRFPIRVELQSLNANDFYSILTEPKNALTLQYTELLKVDNINLHFTEDALRTIAAIAEKENDTNENLGARRLHDLLEKVLEDISFNANGSHPMTDVNIDKAYVEKVFKKALKKYDLSRYII